MKLLVFSDSHGETEPMRLAMRRERPDAVLHLGDHAADAFALAQEYYATSVAYVRGNCDFSFPPCAETYRRTLEGVTIFACHGHRYGVKSSLLALSYAAREQGAALALFGHTHGPYLETSEGLTLLNPGACGGRRPTYAVVELRGGSAVCRIKDVYSEEYQ